MFERFHAFWGNKVLPLLWPKRGFGRVWRFVMLKLSRLRATPHAIALGFAAGASVSFTPLIGLHILLAIAVAFTFRGSLLAAALGTLVGNPATFPAIFALTYGVGTLISPGGDAEGPAEGIVNYAGVVTSEPVPEIFIKADIPPVPVSEAWFGSLEGLWPFFSTMLIGSIPLVILTFGIAYVFARMLLASLSTVRRKAKGVGRLPADG
jgi:uncharacterized protein (DUF2062 family)